jgi:hypothetical protein
LEEDSALLYIAQRRINKGQQTNGGKLVLKNVTGKAEVWVG